MIFDGDRDKLGKYLRATADLMGLRDWHLQLPEANPESAQNGAECTVVYGQKRAIITYRDDWATWDVDQFRYLTVHELMHCHLWSLEQRICDVQEMIGGSAFTVLERAYRENLEHAVDGVARAWAETLPLPEGKRKKGKK